MEMVDFTKQLGIQYRNIYDTMMLIILVGPFEVNIYTSIIHSLMILFDWILFMIITQTLNIQIKLNSILLGRYDLNFIAYDEFHVKLY